MIRSACFALLVALCQPATSAELQWSPVPARAMYCEPVAKLEAYLALRYRERLAILGEERGRGQYRLYYSDHAGTWTMVWADKNGMACVRLFGKHRPALFGFRA